MSELKKPQAPKAAKPAAGVVEIYSCKAEACKHKPHQFGFCTEHYELYMAGVLRGDGKKPLDYEEKLALHLRNKKAAKKIA